METSLTAEQDHQRLMSLLGIDELRPGANGSKQGATNPPNYDEAKAGPSSPLPDPLFLNNGQRVTTAEMWWKERRPEIVEIFDREIYGRVPEQMPRIEWEVVEEKSDTLGDVPVITRQVIGHVDNSLAREISVKVELGLTLPANITGPVPVMLQLGFPRSPAWSGTDFRDAAWHQQVLARGWGCANLETDSVQEDNGAGLTRGIIGLVNHGEPRTLDDWGVLRAWAWGAGRVLDYFETLPDIDARRVGVQGHSRCGKAALLTMAMEPRFAAGLITSSGEAGAKLFRHRFGEEIGNIAGSGEYHWMAGNFVKYAGPLTVDDLPVDAHSLIALCAPRPLMVTAGTVDGDGWADPRGMFLACVGADPVYRLLGDAGLGTTTFPPTGTPVADGALAYYQHTEGHTPVPAWPVFLELLKRYFIQLRQ